MVSHPPTRPDDPPFQWAALGEVTFFFSASRFLTCKMSVRMAAAS